MSMRAWELYLNQVSCGMEIVPSTLHQKKIVGEGYDMGHVMFTELAGYGGSFMNVLPNPQAFLVSSMKIFGITSELLMAGVSLMIGNKSIFYREPAWLFQVRPGFSGMLHHMPVMIAPLIPFRVTIDFDWDVSKRLVEVVLIGQKARPVQ